MRRKIKIGDLIRPSDSAIRELPSWKLSANDVYMVIHINVESHFPYHIINLTQTDNLPDDVELRDDEVELIN